MHGTVASGDMSELRIPDAWTAVAEAALDGPPTVLVIGAADTGKSTFCAWLARRWAERGLGARLIDADVGQCKLGPPGTVSCARIGPNGPRAVESYFVGDISPRRAPADVLGALAQARRACEGDSVVIDTTGWIDGPEALALKRAKALLFGEAQGVLIEREEELRAFRRAWRGLPGFPTHRLRAAAEVRPRSPEARRAYREAAFRAHLDGAVECEIGLAEVAASGTGRLQHARPTLPEGLVLGLNDAAGRLLSLGVLRGLDAATGRLVCRCRPEGAGAVEVRFGRLLVGADGSHTPLAETDGAP